MRPMSAVAVTVVAILISLVSAEMARAQGTTDPVIRDSNVGYIDGAIPGDILRFQFDAAYDINRPTRSEFFWSPGEPNGNGPDIPERSVDYQDLLFGIEKAFGRRTSLFVNLPVRFLDPELNPNTAGLVDMNAGFKHALIYNEDFVATFQFRTYAPTGDVERGLGNGHVSLEPALLIYKPLGYGWVAEAEVRDWIPVEGEAFAGNVIRYGTGLHYNNICWGGWQVVPTAEFIGWTALDGNVTTFDENDLPVIEDATGDTVFNVKVGMRLKYEDLGDVYMGYGNAITGDRWYEDTFRIEFRLYL
ncbi:MAG: hypothetical protein AB7O26_17290 [Planctomycetaceae bacterium]